MVASFGPTPTPCRKAIDNTALFIYWREVLTYYAWLLSRLDPRIRRVCSNSRLPFTSWQWKRPDWWRFGCHTFVKCSLSVMKKGLSGQSMSYTWPHEAHPHQSVTKLCD